MQGSNAPFGPYGHTGIFYLLISKQSITYLLLTAVSIFVIIISGKNGMFDIEFYDDERGYSDVEEFIKELRKIRNQQGCPDKF